MEIDVLHRQVRGRASARLPGMPAFRVTRCAPFYAAVKHFVGKLRPCDPKISCRFETEPGQEAQVDYGEGALTRYPHTGKHRRPRLFVRKLSNSRGAFRETVWNSSSEIWCKLHEEAFARFDGAPHTIRFDNLKEGVIKTDVYDPQLNPLYAKMLKHYDVIACVTFTLVLVYKKREPLVRSSLINLISETRDFNGLLPLIFT